jgi:hypothetical protein
MIRTAGIFSACGLLVALAASPLGAAAAQTATTDGASSSARRADFQRETPSADVQHIADWAVHSGDNKGLPFIVVDKVGAKAHAFDSTGKLIASTPVLLGIALGDKFAPGVASLEMAQTQPWQRITPAGRFFAEEDRNLQREIVLWVDYDAGIAIHKLSRKRTKEKRHERMASSDPAQHRITYGCINVPPAFYDRVVHPNFARKGGMVYVLPDSTPLKAVFKSYDVPGRAAARAPQTPGLLSPHPTFLAAP